MNNNSECIACGFAPIPEDRLHVHAVCGQEYHDSCFDRLYDQQMKDRVPPVCLYCRERIFPRGAVAEFRCAVCLEDVPDLESSEVYVHPDCQRPYHDLCVDTWLLRCAGDPVAADRCAHCRLPLRKKSEWFAKDEAHEWLAEKCREDGEPIMETGHWVQPNFRQFRKRIRAVVANYVELDKKGIPYVPLPVLESVRRQFPDVKLDEHSIMVPALVEVEQLRAKGIPVHHVRSAEYRKAAEVEERRFNDYASLFARYFHHYPAAPMQDWEEDDEETKPAETE